MSIIFLFLSDLAVAGQPAVIRIGDLINMGQIILFLCAQSAVLYQFIQHIMGIRAPHMPLHRIVLSEGMDPQPEFLDPFGLRIAVLGIADLPDLLRLLIPNTGDRDPSCLLQAHDLLSGVACGILLGGHAGTGSGARWWVTASTK